MQTALRRSPTSACWIGLMAGLVAALLVGPSSPRSEAAEGQSQSKQKPKASANAADGKSVDDALLDDLDNALLDGLGDLDDLPGKNAAEGKSPQEMPPDDSPGPEDAGLPGDENDPLGRIGQEMRQAEKLIPQRDKQADAEKLQRQVVEELAKLIEQAQRQGSGQQSSQNSQQQQTAKRQSVQQPKSSSANTPGRTSDKPAADSTNRLGQAEAARPDPELFKGLLKDSWGNLPEREREQMMQMSRERFLPQYELMIERYYRRLAEERAK